ncbi:hypothetical protein SEA_POPPER_56 [Arthrobacter phage Popper]|uniref:Uncharacterized protein n=1 Tax=Arthrobacter phage Popper TaxID=2859633 RepID=A0AAE7WDB4_9CAUD|nr:hypothetical protein QEO78_gp50 [Arthrobacter phage Popper]QYC54973.1 hypothetical protein SEA_POPPER_56 [Arthrobacter phage Popper]
MSAEVILEVLAEEYADLKGEARNDFMTVKRFELLNELERAVAAAGGTFQINKVHLMAAENETRLLLQGSHP